MYSLKRVPIELIPEIIPNDTKNKDIIENLPIYSIEQSSFPISYIIKSGEIWYTRIRECRIFLLNNHMNTYNYAIMKDLPPTTNNDKLLEILLAKERVVGLKFLIFSEFYHVIGLPELSNMIKMLYYVLNI
jgi:hypothetical protein